VGQFNAENVLAAVAGAKALGIDARAIEEGVRRLAAVPGRLERVPNERGLRVYVDFAHKVDALERVLQALAELKGHGRLLVAFGCGGERDKSKRPMMGAVACRIADGVWITSDNPRREDPERIIADILAGVAPGSVSVEPDRVKAIEAVLAAARPGDTVLIAGRGGERTQIVRDPANPDALLEIPLDDCVIAADWLTRAPTGVR
jgi:UDP-N-acetylmuramoyl-L-alanyl-D-glutamate--2,6-diaminopimelate ligase